MSLAGAPRAGAETLPFGYSFMVAKKQEVREAYHKCYQL